jgi:predicted Rossmann fold nucleotide-binding protein DprA/Smf involved in DNA uptake
MIKLADDLKAVTKVIDALSKKLDQLSKKAEKLMKTATGKKVKTKAAPGKKAVKKAKTAPAKKAVKKKPAKATPAPKKTVAKKTIKKTATTVAKKPVRKPSVSATPTNRVLTLMKRYKNGVSISQLKARSGLSDKQISNILHRASKEGKIKRVARGVYQLA